LAPRPIAGLILLQILTKIEKNEPTTVEHRIKLAKIKKLEDSCVLRVPFAVKNISSAGQLLTSIFFMATRLFWG